MKASVVAMLAAAAIGLLPPDGMAQSLSGGGLVVPGERMGPAELQPADQGALGRALGAPDRDEQEGTHEYYRYRVETGGELVVDFDLAEDAPLEISTTSHAYRTREGLGVGSTEGEVRAKLGRPPCEGQAGDEVFLAYDGIRFLVSGGTVTKISIRPHGLLHC